MLDYPDGPRLITWILKKREPYPAVSEGDVTMEEWSQRHNFAAFKMEGGGAKPGDVDHL